MNIFEEVFLLCKMDLGFIPGPVEFDEPLYSTEMGDLEYYGADDIIDTLSMISGVSLVKAGGTSAYEEWFAWKWQWRQDDKWIDIGFTVFENEPIFHWGGSSLSTYCTFADLLNLWQSIRTYHPGVWLHGQDCRVFTPHSFLDLYAMPSLREALNDPDISIQSLAQHELERYKL